MEYCWHHWNLSPLCLRKRTCIHGKKETFQVEQNPTAVQYYTNHIKWIRIL